MVLLTPNHVLRRESEVSLRGFDVEGDRACSGRGCDDDPVFLEGPGARDCRGLAHSELPTGTSRYGVGPAETPAFQATVGGAGKRTDGGKDDDENDHVSH